MYKFKTISNCDVSILNKEKNFQNEQELYNNQNFNKFNKKIKINKD